MPDVLDDDDEVWATNWAVVDTEPCKCNPPVTTNVYFDPCGRIRCRKCKGITQTTVKEAVTLMDRGKL